MQSIQKFNSLNGAQVSREEILRIIDLAHSEEQYNVCDRLEKILVANPDIDLFNINIVFPATEIAQTSFLNGFIDYEENIETGLSKPVPPAEIYQMITDKVVNMVKKANAKDYKRKWEVKGYMIPFNFVSKKRYRGVNHLMLTELEIIENPFFLTFDQVNKLGGKVKKDSQGYEVIYFTKIYEIRNDEKELRFSSFDLSKVNDFATKNEISLDRIVKYPILKYYNVFNGKDIEGIDFDLENFKIGYTENDVVANEKNRLDIPEAIIKNYPKPQPTIQFGGQKAYYSSSQDLVNLPVIEKFETIQDYYRTMFHELSHSTGHHTRLDRKLGNEFGSKDYAFEELVAELGSIFLNSEAGIKWHTNKNHAAYLKSWNAALTAMENDTKFVMKAATQAQKIADFVLQFNTDGNPLYLKDLKKKTLKNAQAPKKPANKTIKVSNKSEKVVKPTTSNVSKIKTNSKDAKKKNLDPVQTKKVSRVKTKTTVVPGKNIPESTAKIDLDKVNPKPFSEKPKSVSVATAIKDVLSLPKFKGIKPLIATLVYNKFKNETDLYDSELAVNLTSDYEVAILKNDSRLHIFYSINDEITLTEFGLEFIQSVKGRLESLRNQKTNYALFPNLAKPKKKPTKKGLKNPIANVVANVVTAAVLGEPETTEVNPVSTNPNISQIGTRLNSNNSKFYEVQGETGKFFQQIEKKPTHSVVITLDGEQGAGKTTALYKFINDFASPGNKCLFISAEEHKDSFLATEKADEHLSNKAIQNTHIISDLSRNVEDFYNLIAPYEIIFIDSWQKIVRKYGKIDLDEDVRQRFDGKVFVIIFQQTTTGRAKGGADVVFDGDIITKMVKEPRFEDNYAYFDKNRYTKIPIENIRYNIASGKTYNPNATEVQPIQEPKNALSSPVQNHQFNFVVG